MQIKLGLITKMANARLQLLALELMLGQVKYTFTCCNRDMDDVCVLVSPGLSSP